MQMMGIFCACDSRIKIVSERKIIPTVESCGRPKFYKRCCKLEALYLSEDFMIRCLKLGTGRGSNAIVANSIGKVNLGKLFSPRLCSCPQEIDFLDQYVSHLTHALRSLALTAVTPVVRKGLLEDLTLQR